MRRAVVNDSIGAEKNVNRFNFNLASKIVRDLEGELGLSPSEDRFPIFTTQQHQPFVTCAADNGHPRNPSP